MQCNAMQCEREIEVRKLREYIKTLEALKVQYKKDVSRFAGYLTISFMLIHHPYSAL